MNNINIPLKEIIIDIDNLPNKFLCSICEEILINEVGENFKILQCLNGHFNCFNCWVKHLKNKQNCIQCRIAINDISSLANNLYLVNEFSTLKICCPNSFFNQNFNNTVSLKNDGEDNLIKPIYLKDIENGCKEILTIEELEGHLKQCKYGFKKCPNGDNNLENLIFGLYCKDYRINKTEEHDKNCPFALIQCEHCYHFISRGDANNHYKNICKEIEIECQNCKSFLKKKLIQEHIETTCPDTLIECRYKSGGCITKFKRNEQSIHLSSEDNHHVYISNILKRFESQITYLLSNHPQSYCNNGSVGFLNTNFKPTKYVNKWVISNYSNKKEQIPNIKCLMSPEFKIGDVKFLISLYPNGNSENCQDYLGLFLDRKPSNNYSDTKKVIFSFDVVNKEIGRNKYFSSSEPINFNGVNRSFGFPKSFLKKEITAENGWLINDTLTININVEILPEEIECLQTN